MWENWEAGKAGMATVILTFIVGALQKETRPTFKRFSRDRRDRPHLARHRRDHLPGGTGHRLAAVVRLDLQIVADPREPVGRQRCCSSRADRCRLHPPRDVAADRGGLHHACGSRRPGPRASRHRSPRRASFSFLLRHALAHHSARLSGDLHGGGHRRSIFGKPAGPACAWASPRMWCRSSSHCIPR